MIEPREQQIIDFIEKSGESSSKEIFNKVDISVSIAAGILRAK